MKHPFLRKIVSGGQTGADRAALDFAIASHIPHGGWCPYGRLAEDGTIDWRYRLRQTPSSAYSQRTEWNVRDSDGTIVFTIFKITFGGTRLTSELTVRHNKPLLHIHKANYRKAPQLIENFITENRIRILNVAGPRISTAPEISTFVKTALDNWWHFALNSQNQCLSVASKGSKPILKK